MKKLFTQFSLLALTVVLLVSCTKNEVHYNDNDNHWLDKEYGVVVYSDGYCPFYVLETYNGYTIVRSTGGYMPYEGDEIYGDISRYGYRDLYNYTENSIIRGEVVEYWLSYSEAQYMIDEMCYSYNKSAAGKTAEKKVIKQGLLKKK
jgi:hypothetical protein